MVRPNKLQVTPDGGFADQTKLDEFLERQQQPLYPVGLGEIDVCRDADAGALSIMVMMANGKCLQDCLAASPTSPAWTNALTALDCIMHSPWWTRVWVLQEAILCKTIAIWGDILVPIPVIEDSGPLLNRHCTTWKCCKATFDSLPPEQHSILRNYINHTSSIESIRMRHSIIRDNQIKMLKTYLQQTRLRQASNSRDKIFGLLGLVRDCPSPIDLQPNYQDSITEVFTSFTLQLFDYHGNLDLLANNERKDSSLNLPSWVLHWCHNIYTEEPDHLVQARIFNFNAWRHNRKSPPYKYLGSDMLELEGIKIDTISYLSAPLTRHPDNILDIVSSFFSKYRDNEGADSRYSFGDTNAFYCTLANGFLTYISTEYKEEHVALGGLGEGPTLQLALASMIWTGFPIERLIVLKDEGGFYSPNELRGLAKRSEDWIYRAMEGRSFMISRQGWIGGVPGLAREGDELWVVKGCGAPLVLRRVDCDEIEGENRSEDQKEITQGQDTFRVIGWGYVRGAMDGEVVNRVEGETEEGREDESRKPCPTLRLI